MGTYRSMIVIIGAIRAPAHEALTASAPRRNPRFLVFHFVVIFCAISSALTFNSGVPGSLGATAPTVSFMAQASESKSRVRP
jgi:hypothetical protein